MAAPIVHEADRQTNTGSGKSIVALRPSNLSAGQQWVVAFAVRATTEDAGGVILNDTHLDKPDGFELLYDRSQNVSTLVHLFAYRMPLVPSNPPASATFQIKPDVPYTATGYGIVSDRITGASTAPVQDPARSRNFSSGNFNEWNQATVQAPAAESLICNYIGFGTNSGTFSFAEGLEDTFSVSSPVPHARVLGGYEVATSPGTTPSRVHSNTVASRWNTITIALAPSADAPDPPDDVRPAVFYRYLRGEA